ACAWRRKLAGSQAANKAECSTRLALPMRMRDDLKRLEKRAKKRFPSQKPLVKIISRIPSAQGSICIKRDLLFVLRNNLSPMGIGTLRTLSYLHKQKRPAGFSGSGD